MDYQIEYAKEGDAPGLARINTLSFESRGFLNDVFPGASQAEIEDYKTMHSWKHMTNPQMHLLKVTDPATGQIVGYGRWLLPEALGFAPSLPVLSDRAKEIAKDPTVYAPRPMNQQLYDGFRGMLETSRKKHTTGKDMGKTPPYSHPSTKYLHDKCSICWLYCPAFKDEALDRHC